MADTTQFDKVKEFNRTFGHAVRDVPGLGYPDIPLGLNLVLEEVEELQEAYENHNEVEFLDALGDILVVIFGLAQKSGMPINEAFDIIHDSNMSKLGSDGLPIYFNDVEGSPYYNPEKVGKIAKGPSYWAPTAKLRSLLDAKKTTNI